MKVRAAVAYEGRPAFSIEELEMSEPGPESILVRMAGCGLCHTDVKAREGGMGVPMPAVLGHEGAGVVERVGAQCHQDQARRPRGPHRRFLRRVPHVCWRQSRVLRPNDRR